MELKKRRCSGLRFPILIVCEEICIVELSHVDAFNLIRQCSLRHLPCARECVA
jgi:hypothetical protein